MHQSNGSDTSLIFVYNANSGLIHALQDYVHKLVSPATYPCSLCALTYSTFGMRREWQAFISKLGHPVEFLHADELSQRYQVEAVPLPAVFLHQAGRLKMLIDKKTLDNCRTLRDLEHIVASSTSNL